MNVTPASLLKSLDLFGYVTKEPAGATVSTLRVFLVLASSEHPPCAMHLAADMELAASTVAKIVRRLIDNRLVEELPDAADWRRRRLALTPFGVKLAERMRKAA